MLKRISFFAIALSCAGCPDEAADCHNTLSCDPPDAGPTVIYVEDAGACNGVCAPAVDGSQWSAPLVFWRGMTNDAANMRCPANVPQLGQLYYENPDQSALPCPLCSCAPSTGACALPETVTVSASPVCPSEADAGVPFNPPSAWDGGCTTNDAIAAVECDGGPCLATVGPILPIDGACVPTQAEAPQIVTWTLAARVCSGGTNAGACDDPGTVCTAAPSTLPPGFSICVSHDGDDPIVQCPDGYPARKVYYLGADDNRGCAPCECGPPQGDACSSVVSLYSDNACSVEVGAVTTESSGPMCVSVPAGSPLGSKRAGPPIYTPGTCQPIGGASIGSVVPQFPVTFCCQ
jgi:hypothetical protein